MVMKALYYDAGDEKLSLVEEAVKKSKEGDVKDGVYNVKTKKAEFF